MQIASRWFDVSFHREKELFDIFLFTRKPMESDGRKKKTVRIMKLFGFVCVILGTRWIDNFRVAVIVFSCVVNLFGCFAYLIIIALRPFWFETDSARQKTNQFKKDKFPLFFFIECYTFFPIIQ